LAPIAASTPPDASAPTTEASAPDLVSEPAPGTPTDPSKP
jgi:hypothetical protein